MHTKTVPGFEKAMEDSKRRAIETHLMQQWKDIEDLEVNEAEDDFKGRKEEWFVQAFSFLRDLPEDSHCWCGHKDIMLPLLEPFYNYFQETGPNSSLKVLWRRLSKEMRQCTRCVVQHHKAKEFYISEFVEEVVRPLLDIVRVLDEERVAHQMKELLHKFNTDTLDPKEDSYGVICIMFEVLMFPSLLEDAEINETLKPFLFHVEETHDLSLAAGQRYPGVYSLLLHTDQGVRRIGLKLAHSLPTFKDEQDTESIQPMLQKCMHCLEYDAFDSKTQMTEKAGPPSFGTHGRPRAVFTKEALWIGLTTVLSVLEPPAFLKGVVEKYPVFVNIVLNHVSEATSVFWNALRCLKLLLEVLGYKLWLGSTLSPGVMRNTLLGQCFHSREERMHVHIFDLFHPFLQSLEALQDGEYENQRRRLLYFLLQQVPLSSNFKPLMTKKARQVAFAIIGRGYTMDPPLPPVECVHVWGPPLVATLKDTGLITSLKQSATDLIQSIIVADAVALAAVSTRQACVRHVGKCLLDKNDDDADVAVDEEIVDGEMDVVGDTKSWISFLSLTKSVESCEQWLCLPILWMEVLVEMMPRYLPISFTKGLMWALGRLSVIDSEGTVSLSNAVVNSDGMACSEDILAALRWVKPKGYDDGAGGEGCRNAVRVDVHHKELVGLLKSYAEKYLCNLQEGGYEQVDWAWEARMGEPCILFPLDAIATFREFGKEVLRRTGNASTLEAGLELLCSSEASAAAVIRGLRHALKLLLNWPLTQCSRGLQQLFFHVWKLLTLGDKELERPASLSQVSQDGGFLKQPNLKTLSLHSSPESARNKFQKDEEAWKKLCKLVASHLWPLLEKTIIEGRQQLEGAGQLMTFTRMLQLLPCVFRNLNAIQKKQVFVDAGRNRDIPGDGSGDELTWFEAFIRWGDVPSPIIHRWWKEAVGCILEDLKGYEVPLGSKLEGMIGDLRKPGQLVEPQRVELGSLLQSVPTSVLKHKFLDPEVFAISAQNEKAPCPKIEKQGDQHYNDVIDLTDDICVTTHPAYKGIIDLTDDIPVKINSSYRDVSNSKSNSDHVSQLLEMPGMYLSRDNLLPQLPKHLGSNQQGATSHSTYNVVPESSSDSLNSPGKGYCHKPEEPQFRRPSVRRAPVSNSSKSTTLDNFLLRFQSDPAKKQVSQGASLTQVRPNTLRPPAVKRIASKPQRGGSKLSSLRNEHREDLEQRAAVKGFVQDQIRERIEREAIAKQRAVADVGSDDKRHTSVPAPDFVPVATGSNPMPREGPTLDTVLRELVCDNEADPLDAAFENIRKTHFLGLKEGAPKTKRTLITLEMPGESGRGGGLQKAQAGLVIRPRQIPRLDDWYKCILSLDYLSIVGISDENSSPGSHPAEQLEKVPLTFKSPDLYMRIFRPLVLEEFKSQLQRAHEDLRLSDGMTSGVLRLMSLERVDEFQLGRFMAEAGSDGAARACSENELLLLSRQPLQSGSQSCHLLAIMESRDRETKSRATVLLLKLYIQAGDIRLTKAKRLLVDRSKWHVTRLLNMTPQLREFQALSSLSSLPLLPVLLSPGLGNHQVKSLDNFSSSTSLGIIPMPLQIKLRGGYNESQLRAIAVAIGGKETMTNDQQLTLIQGPPGTGKTKTIVAILSVLLALRSSKRSSQTVKENESPLPRSVSSSGRSLAMKSSNRDAAAMSRAWQDAARAKELMKQSESQTIDVQGQKQRVLVCAQSNAAVDEIVARICKDGLYGVDGSFFRPTVVRVGALKTVHPKSLPVFIDTLVDQRLGPEKNIEPEALKDKEQTKLVEFRSKLEEVIEFIQVIEALRSQNEGVKEGEKTGQKVGAAESDFGTMAVNIIALGDSAVTAKLNLLYRQRRELTAELATAARDGKKALEENKNKRKAVRKEIIRQADVVVTTLSGCGGDIYQVCMESLSGGKKNKQVQECFFDAVVIDEAAQALEPATLIPFQLLVQTNARCVMVGDPKQLPATVLSQIASRMQYECSMFERLQRAGYPVTMLRTQYRMHPEIRQFPSAHFYDDLIRDGEGLKASRKAVFHREFCFGPYVFFNVVDGQESRKGSSASQSLSNEAEVEVALQVYSTLKKRYPAELWEGRVGVITPYKQQLGLLREQFLRAIGPMATSDIEFNTVDGFQGREVDILILSTVRASSSVSAKRGDIGFVADVRRMNVALTRARVSMWIIGNAATLRANASWASLLSNAEKRSLMVSVRKPYASFFQKKIHFDTPRGRFTSITEPDNVGKKQREDEINGDLSTLEVTPGGPMDDKVVPTEKVEKCILDSGREEKPRKLVSKRGDDENRSRQRTPTTCDGEKLQMTSTIEDHRTNDVGWETDHQSTEMVNGRHLVTTTCNREDLKVRSSIVDSRASEVRLQKDHHFKERSDERHRPGALQCGEELKVRSSSTDRKASEMRRQNEEQRSRRSNDRQSRSETNRRHTGHDRATAEGMLVESLVDDKPQERLHEDGDSVSKEGGEDVSRTEKDRQSRKEKLRVEGVSTQNMKAPRELHHERSSNRKQGHEKTTITGCKRHCSPRDGAMVEGRSPERSHTERDTQGMRHEGRLHGQHPAKQDGEAKEKPGGRPYLDQSFGYKGRYLEGSSSVLDSKESENVRRGENVVRKIRSSEVDGSRNLVSSGHSVHRKDHLGRKGGDCLEELTMHGQVNVSTNLRKGEERGESWRHGLISEREQVVEKQIGNVTEAAHCAPQILQTQMSVKDRYSSSHKKRTCNENRASHNKRTSSENLAAARKRQRGEVTDLVPSDSLHVSKDPFLSASAEHTERTASQTYPGPEQRSRYSTSQGSSLPKPAKGLDIDYEWAQFQKALGESKSTLAPQLDSAPKLSSANSFRKPVKESARFSSTEAKPASDLDNILSGLSTVTQAQVKGSQLKTLSSKSTSMASKHF